MTSTPQTAPGWWSRNWKWAVPLGGATLLALMLAFVALLLMLVFGMLRGTEPYQHAVAQAKASMALRQALGEPIEEGFFVSGNFNSNNASGDASFSIPLSGPHGAATLYVEASKSAGVWSYSVLLVRMDTGGKEIDLNPAAP